MARTKSKGTSLFVKLALIALIVYLSCLSIDLMMRISNVKNDNKARDEQIAMQKDKNKQLEDRKNADLDSDIVEDIARENGYAYSDEKIYESQS